ncbi:3025_t:CDS:2 [Entrophospora sp. SA101]|nr:3025_t:CDS:2 [Entrophospora sp. SA101]
MAPLWPSINEHFAQYAFNIKEKIRKTIDHKEEAEKLELSKLATEIWMNKKFKKNGKKKKILEVNAPTIEKFSLKQDDNILHEKYPKYMGTFPYPYMNRRLHLGHFFFTITKVEFAIEYERMKGKRALFPLGFHCTGMPIKACADKLARELELYGPDFKIPDNDTIIDDIKKGVDDLTLNDNNSKKLDSSGAGTTKVMQKKGKKYCKAMGAKIDWCRSFIITDINPYYDSFVHWQMRKLKVLNKTKFSEHYTKRWAALYGL